MQDWLDRQRDELEARLQREAERALSELIESLLQEVCGAAVAAPAGVVVGLSLAARARRKRTGKHERE